MSNSPPSLTICLHIKIIRFFTKKGDLKGVLRRKSWNYKQLREVLTANKEGMSLQESLLILILQNIFFLLLPFYYDMHIIIRINAIESIYSALLNCEVNYLNGFVSKCHFFKKNVKTYVLFYDNGMTINAI